MIVRDETKVSTWRAGTSMRWKDSVGSLCLIPPIHRYEDEVERDKRDDAGNRFC